MKTEDIKQLQQQQQRDAIALQQFVKFRAVKRALSRCVASVGFCMSLITCCSRSAAAGWVSFSQKWKTIFWGHRGDV